MRLALLISALLLFAAIISLSGCEGAALEDARRRRDKAIKSAEDTIRMVQASKANSEQERDEAIAKKQVAVKEAFAAKLARKKALDKLSEVETELLEAKKKIAGLQKELDLARGKKK